jgi:hypothetical protein
LGEHVRLSLLLPVEKGGGGLHLSVEHKF